jgi:hypothetical protein
VTQFRSNTIIEDDNDETFYYCRRMKVKTLSLTGNIALQLGLILC